MLEVIKKLATLLITLSLVSMSCAGASGSEIQLILQKAIATLPQKQQLVFNMKYFDEMKYTDMSEILGTSVGALKASYFHAVKKIEKIITSN